MKLDDIKTKCFIMTLFIRDDGKRFLLGSGAYEFKDSQMHFVADSMESDVIDVQGDDGYFFAGQVRRPSTQVWDGYIGDQTVAKVDVEKYRRDFLAFFIKNHYYTAVYILPNGEAVARSNGFIVDTPEIKEIRQQFPEYHVGLNFENAWYYKYAEDENGNEIYGKFVNVPLSSQGGSETGGLVWDDYGVVWDEVGAVWTETTSRPYIDIFVDTVEEVYPVWKVSGRAVNPSLSDATSNTMIKYNGTVSAGQTLVIDIQNRTALLNGVNVIPNVEGDWLRLAVGMNRLSYLANNGDAPDSKLEWREILQ